LNDYVSLTSVFFAYKTLVVAYKTLVAWCSVFKQQMDIFSLQKLLVCLSIAPYLQTLYFYIFYIYFGGHFLNSSSSSIAYSNHHSHSIILYGGMREINKGYYLVLLGWYDCTSIQ
jgi:hypothetical protein